MCVKEGETKGERDKDIYIERERKTERKRERKREKKRERK